MNFQYIGPVERSKDYLDLAFRKAREKSNRKLKGEWLDKIKKKELIKLDVIKDQLVRKLDDVLASFPSLRGLPKFYYELLKLTLDYGELKSALGRVSWAAERIRFFHKEYVRRISKCSDRLMIRGLRLQFYGRISSVVKRLDKSLLFLEESRKIVKSYPDVKEMFTVVLFGFPNVGKTTLLNALTGAKGKVAAYAFTTKSINAGYLRLKEGEVQVLDVPGTLARVERMNNIEKIAYLTVKELADVIVYVFDLSGEGYSLQKQRELFTALKSMRGKGKKILVYVSKRDIIGSDVLKLFVNECAKKKITIFDGKQLGKEIISLITEID